MPAIEKMYKEYAARKNFPGMAFGIVMDDQLVYTGNAGYTSIAQKTPVSPKSLFRIASMSKSFTSMAILKLRDEGKLDLDEPIYHYIPEFKSVPLLTKDAPPITIRNLMTHTAGFPEDNPWGDRQLDITDAIFKEMINKGISFSNVPGVSYEYANLGFALQGEIITKVSGKPYQQYITENILKPLGMDHTLWEYTGAPSPLLAHGYRWKDNAWQEEALLHDGVYGAMGGLITSIEDFSKYMSFQMSAWPARNDKETGPVKRSSVREMQQSWAFNNLDAAFQYPDSRKCAMVSSYGYGLRIGQDCDGRKYVGHTGGLPGFGSQWWILPDYGIGVVVFGNLTYARMGDINWAVLDTLVNAANLKPRQIPVSPILKQRQGQLMKLLPDWKYADNSDIFAVNFFPDHSLETRRKQSLDLFGRAGKIKRVSEIVPENQLRGSFKVECEKATIEIYFTLTPENPALIQYLDLAEVKSR